MDYRVLLYYNFVKVEDPAAERVAQEQFCKEQGLLGRILISKEGINGTVSGPVEATEAYKAMMAGHPVFHATEWKEDIHDDHTFLKLHVRVKNEIVHFGVEEADPTEQKGKYVEPEEFREILKRSEEDEDIVILDARSNYETAVGKFKNAVTLDIETFRELPEHIDELEQYKDYMRIITNSKHWIYIARNGPFRVAKMHAFSLQRRFPGEPCKSIRDNV
jgi:UPF0176 protein